MSRMQTTQVKQRRHTETANIGEEHTITKFMIISDFKDLTQGYDQKSNPKNEIKGYKT